MWSLVGNQALFAGREAVARKEWAEARHDARRAQALLLWSPSRTSCSAMLPRASATARARCARIATRSRRIRATGLHGSALAQVARGAESDAAYDRVRELNPLEEGLPGE